MNTNTKTLQPYEELERRWAETNHLDPAGMVACSSGTAALHLALEALGLPFGSEVLVPDYTMVACPRAVTLAGLTPVFVDCDDRLCIDPAVITEDTALGASVLMPVAVYGREPGDDVWFQAGLHNLKVVYDLAEAHGVPPHPETDAACWSFYRNKIVAGEEGGAVWFRDRGLAKVARELRSLGFTEAHDFRHRPRGHNYRLANCLAEKVLASLRDFGYNSSIRVESIQRYDEACPEEWRTPPRDAPWVYDVRVPGMTRSRMRDVVGALNARGVEARMGFYPMSLQDEYREARFFHEALPSRSYLAAMEVFYLPLLPGPVTLEEATRTFDVIREVLGEERKEVTPAAS